MFCNGFPYLYFCIFLSMLLYQYYNIYSFFNGWCIIIFYSFVIFLLFLHAFYYFLYILLFDIPFLAIYLNYHINLYQFYIILCGSPPLFVTLNALSKLVGMNKNGWFNTIIFFIKFSFSYTLVWIMQYMSIIIPWSIPHT